MSQYMASKAGLNLGGGSALSFIQPLIRPRSTSLLSSFRVSVCRASNIRAPALPASVHPSERQPTYPPVARDRARVSARNRPQQDLRTLGTVEPSPRRARYGRTARQPNEVIFHSRVAQSYSVAHGHQTRPTGDTHSHAGVNGHHRTRSAQPEPD